MINTKNEMKAYLSLMINMAQQAKFIADKLCDELGVADDEFYDILNTIQDGERTDIEEIMKELDDSEFLKDCGIEEEGNSLDVPTVELTSIGYLETRKKCNGGYLITSIHTIDGPSTEVNITWADENANMEMDVCTAMVKTGELAEADHLSKDNKDISVYVWENPAEEDYTYKRIIPMEKVVEICKTTNIP